MRQAVRNLVLLSIALALFARYSPAAPQQAATTPAKPATSRPAVSKSVSKTQHKKGRRKTSWKKHGQQGIQSDRVRAIQEALVREKYLIGEPTGVWDTRSQAAMAKYQTDNGWQSKVTPDSRALIKLGLGPDHSQQALSGTPQASGNGVASATTPRATTAPEKQ